MFNHFLVTRFNVKVDSWSWTKNGQIPLTNQWLNHRFELFENYCLPSVKNQVSQNFKWCIFFDTDTPEFFKNKISGIADHYPVIDIVFINGNDELPTALKSFIKNNTSASCRFVITTRLDNDDLIHKDFISTIQKLYKPIKNLVIDIRCGYQVSIENETIEVRDYENKFNPFISVVEELEDQKTIMSRMHTQWESFEHVIIYKTKRLWIELTHGKNLINSRNYSLPASLSFDSNDFAIKRFKIIREDKNYFEEFLGRIIIKVENILKQALFVSLLVMLLKKIQLSGKRFKRLKQD